MRSLERTSNVTPMWEGAAWRAAISAVAGFLASIFALGALLFSLPADPMTRLVEDGRPSANVLGLLAAVAGAGLPVAITVLSCLLVWDAARWLRGKIVFRRDAFSRALSDVARSIAAQGAIVVAWVRPVAVMVAHVILWVIGGGASVIAYLFPLSFGVMAVRESTLMVNALLEDPPSTAAMAIGMTGALGLMYAGIGLLAFCAWIAYQVARAGLRAL
jgi:hypothetical protein